METYDNQFAPAPKKDLTLARMDSHLSTNRMYVFCFDCFLPRLDFPSVSASEKTHCQ